MALAALAPFMASVGAGSGGLALAGSSAAGAGAAGAGAGAAGAGAGLGSVASLPTAGNAGMSGLNVAKGAAKGGMTAPSGTKIQGLQKPAPITADPNLLADPSTFLAPTPEAKTSKLREALKEPETKQMLKDFGKSAAKNTLTQEHHSPELKLGTKAEAAPTIGDSPVPGTVKHGELAEAAGHGLLQKKKRQRVYDLV